MKRATTCTLGLDIGSTTAKAVLRSPDGEIIDAIYQRHGAAVRQTLAAILADLSQRHPGLEVRGAITGSGALSISDVLGLEVFADDGLIYSVVGSTADYGIRYLIIRPLTGEQVPDATLTVHTLKGIW